jgi:Fe-S cluster assembly protein SufD
MDLLSTLDDNIKLHQKNLDNAMFSTLRSDAYSKVISGGVPTRRTESYKYTNLKKSLETNIALRNFPDSNIESSKFENSEFHNLYSVNGLVYGSVDGIEISKLGAESDVVIKSNSNALSDDFLYNINESTINTGHHFKFSKNFTSSKPILIHNIIDTKESGFYNIHNTFKVETGSKVEILETYQTTNDTNIFCNFASSVVLDENAIFLHVHHQDFNIDSSFANNIRAQVARNSNYQSFTTNIGSILTRNNIHIDLNAEGSLCTASGIYTLQDSQHCDINSLIIHNAPNTDSHQLYKGIMSDKSRGVFTGLIRVNKDAQLVNSHQLNRNLILNKGAHANSRPQLEIFADDVKCAHGSTTGQLSDQELFYFESRGIRPEKAKMMLARAFTYDVLLKIENETIRDYIQKEVTEKFEAKAFGK